MDATVTVTAVEEVGPDTYVVQFESPTDFAAQPGQFVKLSAEIDGESYDRFYTLSSPDVDDTFETTIEVDPSEGGPFSEYLANLGAGDAVGVSGPFGADYYEGESRVVVLAGGPGVGPAIGIGERALADGNEIAVIYQDDAPAHEERLDALRNEGATVHVIDGSNNATIDDLVYETLTGATDEQVYVYGFASFVDAAEEAIDAAGGDPDAAKVENFG